MSDISEYGVHTKAELLFPATLIPSLRDLRGEEWRALVDRVAALPETHPDSLAFVLMMIELDGCLKCNSNNYKFLRVGRWQSGQWRLPSCPARVCSPCCRRPE